MKLIKRGLPLILVITLLSSISIADYTWTDSLTINLARENQASNQNFEGSLTINLSKEIPKDAVLTFTVNNVKYNKPLAQVLKDKNLQVLPRVYERIQGSTSSSKELIFNTPGSKVEVGIDFAAAGSRQDTITQINKFSMAFNGMQVSNSFPTLAMDIGNDNSVDYTFKGGLTGGFEDSDSSYLADNNPDLWKGIRPSLDVLCEKINLKPSSKYKILARAKEIKAGAKLEATISNEPLSSMTCVDDLKCCQLNPGNLDTEISCDLDIELNEQSDYFTCISASTLSEDIESAYFQIAADTDTRKVQGYYNAQPSSTLDYFIKVKHALFQTTINQQTENKNMSIESLTDYINTPDCGNACLLIPINVSSVKPGKLMLNNLILDYESEGPTSISSFVSIRSLPERLNTTRTTFTIPLSSFTDILTSSPAKDSTIYAEITIGTTTVKSNTVKFNSVAGPTAQIGLSNLNPGVGEEVDFTAYGYSSSDSRLLSYYEWEFGDNITAKGEKVKYTYLKEGTYEITLTVFDAANYSSKKKARLIVAKGTSENQFDRTLQLIKTAKSNLESGSSQVKDTASLLGITELLNSLEANVTSLNNSASQITLGNKTDAEKTSALSSLNQQLIQLSNKIPLSLAVSVSTFSPKITSTSQIPNEAASGNELKRKVMQYQSSVDVNGEARIVSINYETTTEEFVLIKKVIDEGTGKIYEVLPLGATIKEVLTPGYTLVTPDRVFKISGVTSFLYTLEGTNLGEALQTKTIVVSDDIESIEITDKEDKGEVAGRVQIGSNLGRILVVAIALIVICLIVYFGLFFKGGLLKKKPARSFFKNVKDYLAVKTFILQSLKKGLKEDQIKTALKSKKWKDEQINAVFKEIKEEQEKAKKVAEKKKKELEKTQKKSAKK